MSKFLRPNPRTEHGKHSTTISLAMWNVRRLNTAENWQQLGRDCAKYHFDLTGLQETKVIVSDDLELASGHKTGAHTTMNRQVQRPRLCRCPQLKPFVHRWWYMSDRVSVLDLAIPCRDITFCQCRVVTAYGSTSQRESTSE